MAVGCQLFYSNQPVKDPAFDVWPASISTQAVQCLSIVTACFPYLKPFLTSLESGLIRADDLRRRGGTDVDYYNTSNAQKSDKSKSAQSASAQSTSTQIKSNRSKFGKVLGKVLTVSRQASRDYELSTVPTESLQLRPDPTTVMIIEGEGLEWDGQSQSSQSRIIRETRTWSINVQKSESVEDSRN